ncbi:conjugal transfer protein TraV, partial [Thalassospira xiamenensis]
PMAPEPMAVLEPAQVMRVLVTAYTDDNGYANMPGYVYVEVTPRQWSFGKAANMRPTRVVPLQIRQQTQKQLQQQRQKSKGVDAMEVINPMNRNN